MKTNILFSGLIALSLLGACSPEKQITKQTAKQIDKQVAKQVDKQKAKQLEKKFDKDGNNVFPNALAQPAAKALFAYQEGVWDAKWDWIDKDGKLLGSVSGTETFTTILDGSVQEILNDVPAMGPKTKAVMTYNEAEGKIIFFSMGAKGDYWLMKQDPVSGTMISEPHTNPDGTSQIIRFTTTRKTENEMDIIMESSGDSGTWTKLFTQYMVRRVGEE